MLLSLASRAGLRTLRPATGAVAAAASGVAAPVTSDQIPAPAPPAAGGFDIFNPSEEHRALRDMVRDFTRDRVEPQALEFNRREEFNFPLFRELGDQGLLGVTVPPEYGGSGMDATAACIIHEELSASDPAFCLSYLAHSMLFVNNLALNGSEDAEASKRALASGGATCATLLVYYSI